MPSERDLAGAALVGAASGMRTMSGPAALALRGRLPGGPAVAALAAGELVADKLPFVPPRTDPPALAARAASGAVSGSRLAGGPGAALGALAAAGSSFATMRARSALVELTGLPDPVVAVAEDGVALGAAALATAPRRETDEDESKLRRVGRGLVAGLVGTAAMTAAQVAVLKATGGKPSRAPEKVARRVFGRRAVKRKQRETLNTAMHWAYGTGWGVPLGLTGRPGLLGGVAHGLSVWGAGLAELPAFGVAPPPWEQSPGALAQDAAMHVVYGVAVAGALSVLP